MFLRLTALGSVCASVLMLMQACVTLTEETVNEKKYLHKTHPLVGGVWSTKEARLMGDTELSERIKNDDLILIGEYHDNPQHHRLQAQLLSRLPGDKAVVGFEHIDSKQEFDLNTYLKEPPGDAKGLGEVLNWQKSGWPPYALFLPVFKVILEKKWQITPLMFERKKAMQIFKEGYSAVLTEDVIKQLKPEKAFAQPVLDYRASLMKGAHCGMMPAKYLPKMVTAQIAKDAHMAHELHKEIQGKRGIVLSGNGHIRKDWGIPVFLKKLRPKSKMSVISIIEVEEKKLDPSQYLEASASFSDYVIFTAAYSRTDPCERMKKFHDKMKKKHQKQDKKQEIKQADIEQLLNQMKL